MNEESIRVDVAEAIGKATAAIALEGALMSSLVLKGIFSMDDLATISGVASASLDQMQGLPDDAKTIGKGVLSGFALSWTKHITKN